MMKNCKCVHHWLAIALAVLTWVSAGAFFWGVYGTGIVWGQEAGFYFMAVVVLSLLNIGMRGGCKCCCNTSSCGKMTCGDCSKMENKSM